MRKKPKKLTADELMPLQDVTWPSDDAGKKRGKRGGAATAVKTEDDMDTKQDMDVILDVDDIPAIPDDLYSTYHIPVNFIAKIFLSLPAYFISSYPTIFFF